MPPGQGIELHCADGSAGTHPPSGNRATWTSRRIVGLLVGLVVGPLADRLATNAPRTTRSSAASAVTATALVMAGTALLGGACGLVSGSRWRRSSPRRSAGSLSSSPEPTSRPPHSGQDRPAGRRCAARLRTIDDPSVEWILCALGAGLLLFLIVLVYPRGLGMGDVKLSAFLGPVSGSPSSSRCFSASFLAFVPALLVFVRHGREARKKAIPLGPFLALGA